jgi:hypothetical protein
MWGGNMKKTILYGMVLILIVLVFVANGFAHGSYEQNTYEEDYDEISFEEMEEMHEWCISYFVKPIRTMGMMH